MQIKFSQIAALLILLFKKFHNSYTFNTLFASKMQPETSVLENDFFAKHVSFGRNFFSFCTRRIWLQIIQLSSSSQTKNNDVEFVEDRLRNNF